MEKQVHEMQAADKNMKTLNLARLINHQHKIVKKSEYKYEVKVKSKVHPGLCHTVTVDLFCHEKLESKKKPKKKPDKSNCNR